ncbi:MAG TPA: histidine kinase dimerization/phosphoacceptor domain -containing protein [Rhizomicrobium sp.]
MNTTRLSESATSSAVLAQASVDSIRSPLLVLDKDLRVIAANDFFQIFCDLDRQDIIGRAIFGLGDGQWNIPELRSLLVNVLAHYAPMEVYEIERETVGPDRRTMYFNARPMFYEQDVERLILLSIRDVTEERAAEAEMRRKLHQKDILLQETQHRIGNSLQIIASILLLKARTVQSEETRLHLHDAHGRVMSIAAVQQQLQASRIGDSIELGPYLSRLCEGIASSMIADDRRISLKVVATGGIVSSSEAVSIGLIVTELVINALKHAFVQRTNGEIIVSFESFSTKWRLSVSDNGTGKSAWGPEKAKPGGLGSSIVEALAHQLESHLSVSTDEQGYKTTITHGFFE